MPAPPLPIVTATEARQLNKKQAREKKTANTNQAQSKTGVLQKPQLTSAEAATAVTTAWNF